jgi:hypothetical protein
MLAFTNKNTNHGDRWRRVQFAPATALQTRDRRNAGCKALQQDTHVRGEISLFVHVFTLFYLLKLFPLAATRLEKSEKTENFISKNR